MACVEGKLEQGMYLCSQCHLVVSVNAENQALTRCPCCESDNFLSKDGVEYQSQTIPDAEYMY